MFVIPLTSQYSTSEGVGKTENVQQINRVVISHQIYQVCSCKFSLQHLQKWTHLVALHFKNTSIHHYPNVGWHWGREAFKIDADFITVSCSLPIPRPVCDTHQNIRTVESSHLLETSPLVNISKRISNMESKS